MHKTSEIIAIGMILLIGGLLILVGTFEARATTIRYTAFPPTLPESMADICRQPGQEDAPAYSSTAAGHYDPLARAIASIGRTRNLEAGVPSQCYTKTAGEANPCWTCHTARNGLNFMSDWTLQEEYSFSDAALDNHWSNLFVDRTEEIAAISDAEMMAYIKTDNYTPLREALETVEDYPGYVPDLDFNLGFDDEGFARDGSRWRAIRYKPFLGTFWPTNGNTDDVLIRLPEAFRIDSEGNESRDIYKINLAIIEAVIATDWAVPTENAARVVEPISEVIAGLDLDGDGELSDNITVIRGMPEHYVGGAENVDVLRHVYPEGVEFLHSVRYVDVDNPSLLSTRMKELRYSHKVRFLDTWALARRYEREFNDKDAGHVPAYTGTPLVGLRNDFGWQLQGFIEDADGRLRLQTEEEHRFCMGCHSSVGATVDQTFTLARKVPGSAGWQYQYLEGIPDVPQFDHDKPEILTYFERVTGGDEFRANTEILDRFFPGGELDEAEVLRAAPGGDKDILHLIQPSRERAALLNKAYMALVKEQTFELGRDTIISPPVNVHEAIENGDTELRETGKVFFDGRLWLDWSGVEGLTP
ncbi:MAG: hypothetical protein KDJ65_17225 [Anaerolineae bacterium]|nr:hypothetical protein [Anaerolineae bacterium]